MCCGVEGMQRVLMKWDGRSGGSHFQFALPKIQLWHQLAEKAGVTVSLDMYQNRSAWLPYVSRLQEFTTFSISVWYRMKKVHLPLSCILTFLHIYKNKKKKICFYSNEQLEKHRYWQNPSNFLKQLTGILKDSAMLTGGYGHVTASTHSSVFYHVISVFRLLIFLFFFFFNWQKHSLSYFILERRVFRWDVLSDHNFGWSSLYFILFYLLFLGHIQTWWVIKEQGYTHSFSNK